MSVGEPEGLTFGPLPDGQEVVRLPGLEPVAGVIHLVTTRGTMDPRRVRADPGAAAGELAAAVGLAGAAWCRQVHGGEVRRVGEPGPAGEGDGLLTDRPSLALAAFSADCPLVLLADVEAPAVAIVHASWRSTVRGIVARAVRQLVDDLGARAGRVVAAISPSAGPCCYEVGPEVLDAAVAGLGESARGFFRRGEQGRLHFDLWSANRSQLLEAGVRGGNVHAAGVCTLCRNDLFPSHRREGDRAGRFLALVALPP